jgi:hypothetical protein
VAKTKTNLDLWEKQKSESSKAYAGFCSYRDMGVCRSLAKAVNTVHGESTKDKPSTNIRQLSTWSSKYGWVARVEAYDVYLEAKSRKEHELAIQKMVTEHAEAAVITRSKAMERIGLIGEDELNELTPKEALEYLKEAVKIERISRGAPDQLVEHSGTIVQIIDDIPRGNKDASTTQKPNHE